MTKVSFLTKLFDRRVEGFRATVALNGTEVRNTHHNVHVTLANKCLVYTFRCIFGWRAIEGNGCPKRATP